MNLLDNKYTTYANELLEQVIGVGLRVDEIRCVLEIMRLELDRRINELAICPVKKNLPGEDEVESFLKNHTQLSPDLTENIVSSFQKFCRNTSLMR